MYFLNEHQATYASGGQDTIVPARRSYQFNGAANQALSRRLRARARVDYFSDITVQQTYNSNLYEASRRARTIAMGLTGAWGTYTVTGAYERAETFFGTSSSSSTAPPRA